MLYVQINIRFFYTQTHTDLLYILHFNINVLLRHCGKKVKKKTFKYCWNSIRELNKSNSCSFVRLENWSLFFQTEKQETFILIYNIKWQRKSDCACFLLLFYKRETLHVHHFNDAIRLIFEIEFQIAHESMGGCCGVLCCSCCTFSSYPWVCQRKMSRAIVKMSAQVAASHRYGPSQLAHCWHCLHQLVYIYIL